MANVPNLSKLQTPDVAMNRHQDQVRDTFNAQAKTLKTTQAAVSATAGVKSLQNQAGQVSYDAKASSHFTVTLGNHVTASSLNNVAVGQVVTFTVQQPATGGTYNYTHAWPKYINGNQAHLVRGAGAVGVGQGLASSQSFRFDGQYLWATGPIVTGI